MRLYRWTYIYIYIYMYMHLYIHTFTNPHATWSLGVHWSLRNTWLSRSLMNLRKLAQSFTRVCSAAAKPQTSWKGCSKVTAPSWTWSPRVIKSRIAPPANKTRSKIKCYIFIHVYIYIYVCVCKYIRDNAWDSFRWCVNIYMYNGII